MLYSLHGPVYGLPHGSIPILAFPLRTRRHSAHCVVSEMGFAHSLPPVARVLRNPNRLARDHRRSNRLAHRICPSQTPRRPFPNAESPAPSATRCWSERRGFLPCCHERRRLAIPNSASSQCRCTWHPYPERLSLLCIPSC